MTQDQLDTWVSENRTDIAAIKESLKSAHKRIDENDRTTEGIHKLASSVESLTLQIKHLTESVEGSIKRLEESLRGQGERIGVLEKKPAARWEGLVTQVIGLVVAAVVGFFLSRFI